PPVAGDPRSGRHVRHRRGPGSPGRPEVAEDPAGREHARDGHRPGPVPAEAAAGRGDPRVGPDGPGKIAPMKTHSPNPPFAIRPARPDDCATIAGLIRDLAIYERLEHEAKATADDLRRDLFGPRPFAEALIGEVEGEAV